MASVAAWFSETFNAAASETDLISSRSLNITRIGAVVVPVLTGVWTAISEAAEIPPFNDTEFQKTLILMLVPFVGLLSIADMFSRAISARASSGAKGLLTFAKPVSAVKAQSGLDIKGRIVAYRGRDDSVSTGEGEYLFLTEAGELSWEAASSLSLGP